MNIMNTSNKKISEILIEKLLLFSATTAIMVVCLIFAFIFLEGLPVIQKYGIWHFITGKHWYPEQGIFGILPMIIGSFVVTFMALAIGIPLGVGCAIFLAELAPPWLARLVRPGIELLAGIPSVVYGFYGLVVLVPFIRDHLGGRGFSALAAALILAVMILPTIVNISEDAIRAVPREYKEGSMALGATHWQTIKKVILPGAASGIVTAVVLGMGRALGETMAVILVAGNVSAIPDSILASVRTLTANIAIEMGYAADDHARALFATGIVLFVLIMLLNLLLALVPKKATTGE
ncbi:MAG: phosphate ABC transporter permease subunit PstC [Desulfurispora sp.]|uniref:phosphate ABC transporter permease subunit PstC n=1 Tax=Desulfurispora sp. TaxID=3014275 RepID=UPI00404B4E34